MNEARELLDALQFQREGDGASIIVQGQRFYVEAPDPLFYALIDAFMPRDDDEPETITNPVGKVLNIPQARFRTPINAARTAAGSDQDYGDYTAIEARIMAALGVKSISPTNRSFLIPERTFILERGERKTYPGPADLYSGDALFREFVDQCIRWQQQAAQDSSSRVNMNALVKSIANYIRPRTGWLEFERARKSGNESVPGAAPERVITEVIRAPKT